MTKKDYELIARALAYTKPSKIARPNGYEDRLYTWNGVIEVLARDLEFENDRFDINKFYQACGKD